MDVQDSETTIFALIMVLFSIGVVLWFRKNKELFRRRPKDPALGYLKERVKPVHSIIEKLEFFEDPEASYTLDKEDIYLCLRDETGKLYDDNTLIYVIIHECAHALCSSTGHTEEWSTIFEELLRRATSLGIYNPNQPIVKNYCGVNIPESERTIKFA